MKKKTKQNPPAHFSKRRHVNVDLIKSLSGSGQKIVFFFLYLLVFIVHHALLHKKNRTLNSLAKSDI